MAQLGAASLVAGAGSWPSIQLSEGLAALSDDARADAREYIAAHEAEELGEIQAYQERHEQMQREIDENDGDGFGM